MSNINYSGEFTVEVEYENGCTSLATTSVSVNPNPVVDLGDDIIYLTGVDTVLNAEGPGLTYLWSTGETKPSIVVSQDGVYSVTVMNGDGCIAIDEVQVLGNSASNIARNLGGLTLYPNPVRDVIIVGNINTSFSYIIYNLTGDEVSKGTTEDHQVSIGELPSGLFYLIVFNGKEYWVGRFVKI